VRLALVAVSDEFDGWATARRLKPHKMSMKKLLNVTWHFLTEHGTKKGIEKLKADLLRPLPGEAAAPASEEIVQHELAMFSKALAAGKK
jgi:hypothetical protein